jgi:hypothetical protein
MPIETSSGSEARKMAAHKPCIGHPRKLLTWHESDSGFLTAHKQMFLMNSAQVIY